MLEIGTIAPDFTLPDQNGQMHTLSDYRGQKVVLYFYPRDNTSGCTKQACAFAALYNGFAEKNAVVIGVSRDSAASHKKFAEKNNLPFILLTDADARVTDLYGAWQEKTMCGKTSMGVVRTTYIIDEQGMIEKVMPKVKADTNPQDVLRFLG